LQDLQLVIGQSRGVRFNAPFVTRGERKPPFQEFEQTAELAGREKGRRASPQEQSVDFARGLQPGDLDLQGLKIIVNEVGTTGDQGEVTVPTAVGTKRDVNVARAWCVMVESGWRREVNHRGTKTRRKVGGDVLA
jgi:hypothetical protein